MRRRRGRGEPDLGEAWLESLSCDEVEWWAQLAALPPVPPLDPLTGVDEEFEQHARAWLSWPGRAAWLAANPARWASR